jgi:DNA repair protein RadC
MISQYALKGNASGIIIAHNHPSGNSNPSESDQKITNKIKEAGNLLDIQLLDHIIVTPERDVYRSFADEGHL